MFNYNDLTMCSRARTCCRPRHVEGGITRRALLGGSAALALMPGLGLGTQAEAQVPPGAFAVLRHDAILRPVPRGAAAAPETGITGERAAFRVRDATGAAVDFRPAPG
jgi:hypothetical protein